MRPDLTASLAAGISIKCEFRKGGIAILDEIADEWRALCAEGPWNQPFFRPEWVRATIRAFVPGDTLVLLTARASGRLRAVLPLLEDHGLLCGLPARRLRAPTSIHSCRFDLPGSPDDEGDAGVRAVWRTVRDLSPWDVVTLPSVPEGGSAERLLAAAAADGFPIAAGRQIQMPYIPLSDWDGNPDFWLMRTSRHFRHTFRTASRKTPSTARLCLRRVDRAEPSELERFYALERSGWKGVRGTAIAVSHRTRQFYTEIANSAERFGYLSLYFLELGSFPIAAHFGLALGGRYFALKCAYDEAHAHCAPGHLIVNRILRDCAEQGLSVFEFLGPWNEWKAKWTDRFIPHRCYYVFRNSLYGHTLHSAVRLRSKAARAIRALRCAPPRER